ncbi:LysR substrate-binding domain-containing protein [Cupriavidus necator]
MAEGAVEVGVFSAHTPAPGLQVFPYRVDELVVAVPEGHDFAGKRRVTFFELAQHELVVPHTQSSTVLSPGAASPPACLPSISAVGPRSEQVLATKENAASNGLSGSRRLHGALHNLRI